MNLLHDTGAALYGARWQSELARDLGVSIRTMQRWASGAAHPAGVYVELLHLLHDRGASIAALRDRIRDRAAAIP